MMLFARSARKEIWRFVHLKQVAVQQQMKKKYIFRDKKASVLKRLNAF